MMNDATQFATGILGLDTILAGGLECPSLAVIVGSPGAGKTMLASQILFHTNTPLAALGDTIVVVQQYEIAGELRRLLAVLRMRMSFFDRTLRELVLDEQAGIRILAPEESVIGLLDPGAQQSGGVAPFDARSEADNEPLTGA